MDSHQIVRICLTQEEQSCLGFEDNLATGISLATLSMLKIGGCSTAQTPRSIFTKYSEYVDLMGIKGSLGFGRKQGKNSLRDNLRIFVLKICLYLWVEVPACNSWLFYILIPIYLSIDVY